MLVVPVLVLAMVASGCQPRPRTWSTSFRLSSVDAIHIDPSTGDVLVTGDDELLVFDPAGRAVATVALPGASGMAQSGDQLYVTQCAQAAIAQVDLPSQSVVRTFPLGRPLTPSACPRGIAAVGSLLWFLAASDPASSNTAMATLDPSTAAVQERLSPVGADILQAVPGRTDEILAIASGIGETIRLLRTTVTPIRTLASSTAACCGAVAFAPDGRVFYPTATQSGGRAIDTQTLQAVGPVFHTPVGAVSVAYTARAGGLLVGFYGGPYGGLTASFAASAVTAQADAIAGDQSASDVVLSPDGRLAYYVQPSADGAGPASLNVVRLEPTISAVTPHSFVTGVPGRLDLSGDGLGGAASVRLGGTPLVLEPEQSCGPAGCEPVASSTAVHAAFPPSTPPGTYPLVVRTPLGVAATMVTVLANTGASLTGTAADGGVPVSGIEATLSGGGQPAATVTTGTDGRYRFDRIGYGDAYILDVHDPARRYPDRRITNLTLIPNTTAAHDLALAPAPIADGVILARVALPAETLRRELLDPTTGHIFVSVGDGVVVVDRSGDVIGTIDGLPGADGLVLDGTALYVNAPAARRIVRFDTSSLLRTGSWPTTVATNGALGYAAGHLWFTNGPDQFVGWASLDPVTGDVALTGITIDEPNDPTGYDSQFGSVPGEPNELLVFTSRSSPPSMAIYDATTFPPRLLNAQLRWSSSPGLSPAVFSPTPGLVFDTNGTEFARPSLLPTGTTYPVTCCRAGAYSPALSGLVAFGTSVFRLGTRTPSHLLADAPIPFGLAIDPAGDRVFTVTAQDQLVITSLRPEISAVRGNAHAVVNAAAGTAAVVGTGLGAALSATLDGTSVAFQASDPNNLTITHGVLARGPHHLQVTTPWGTTEPFTLQAADAPTAPQITAIVPGPGSVTVSWAPPIDDGGAPVFGYEALATPGHQWCITSQLTCVVTGLTPGTPYTFRVKAGTDAGIGPFSPPSETTIPA